MNGSSKRCIEDVHQDCMVCGRPCVNRRSLGNHVNRSHPDLEGLMGYVLKYFLFGSHPKCMCGCGEDVSWHKVLYRFNDYLTGHNPSGFKVKQPEFSEEQLTRRKESIKKKYQEDGDSIKRKISESVSRGLKRPDVKDRLSSSRKQLWSNESYREMQRLSRIESWKGKAGDDRRKKVFTPEFGKKISVANMARDSHTRSAVEMRFVDHLASIGLEVECSKWFNFDERTWCADVWLPEKKTIIEFDGAYWHGLDRTTDFTYDQIVNLTNDLAKNSLARARGLNLLRIKEGTDFTSVRSYDDLVNSAYHVVAAGKVVKEGTFRLSDDNTPLLTRNRIVKATIAENGRNIIEGKYVPLVENFLRAHVDYWGWFYPTSSSSLKDVLISVGRSSHSLGMSPAGSEWLKSRVRSYWDVDAGPAQKFNCDGTLRSVVSYRLGINGSKKYTYEIDGIDMECQETFDITLKNIRNGFVVQRNKVSWFKPTWAAYVYSRYCTNTSPVVWDPSIGFSARLLGFCGVFDRGTYIGTDPSKRMCDDARRVASEVLYFKKDLKVEVMNTGSEKWIPKENSLDLVFTSPPYFDSERYFDEEGQCWRDYPDLGVWREKFLRKTFENARVGLNSSGHLVINISARYRDVVIEDATCVGFSLNEEFSLPTFRDHFDRGKGHAGRNESFLVFRK